MIVAVISRRTLRSAQLMFQPEGSCCGPLGVNRTFIPQTRLEETDDAIRAPCPFSRGAADHNMHGSDPITVLSHGLDPFFFYHL